MSNSKNSALYKVSGTESKNCYKVVLSSPDLNPFLNGEDPSQTMQVTFVKKGPKVMVCWPSILGTAGTESKLGWSNAVPQGCRPYKDYYTLVPVVNEGSSAVGLLKISRQGSLIFSTAADNAFAETGDCGIRSSSCFYFLY